MLLCVPCRSVLLEQVHQLLKNFNAVGYSSLESIGLFSLISTWFFRPRVTHCLLRSLASGTRRAVGVRYRAALMPYRSLFTSVPKREHPKVNPPCLQRLQPSDRVPSGFITQGQLKSHGTQLFKKNQSSTAQGSVRCYVLDVARTVNYISQRLPYCGATTIVNSCNCSGARPVATHRAWLLLWLDSRRSGSPKKNGLAFLEARCNLYLFRSL